MSVQISEQELNKLKQESERYQWLLGQNSATVSSIWKKYWAPEIEMEIVERMSNPKENL